MKKAVIFSGAGLSAESGIPTFRSNNGLWDNYRIEDVTSPEGWEKDPALVLDFYEQRFEQMQNCKPNAAHYAIAQLQEQFDVLCITQNIDTLLERAGVKNVIHLHGRIDYAKCECHFLIPPQNIDEECDYRSEISKAIQMGDRCPKCSKKLRPDVVWFGEAVSLPKREIRRILPEVEVFIGVGTSAKVYPASSLLYYFDTVPHRYFIDPDPPEHLRLRYTFLEGTAAEKIPELVASLLAK
ncbi:MAG: Sir2 family NAD-dependent protein deacetylase [Cyanobacteria bacterium P01_E01_bin.42]